MREITEKLGREARHGLYFRAHTSEPYELQTYEVFAKKICRYEDELAARGITAGMRILFPFENDPEFVAYFLAMVNVGILPLSIRPQSSFPNRPSYTEFVNKLADRFGASLVFSWDADQSCAAIRPLATVRSGFARARTAPDHDPTLAFVQFSSGSTSFPKGVPISRQSLDENLRQIIQHDRRTQDHAGFNWLPLCHDMGLIGGLLSSLYVGHDLWLSTPASFLLHPLSFLDDLSRFRITVVPLPSFALSYLVKYIRTAPPAQVAGWDFSALEAIYVGSDPIDCRAVVEFCDVLSACGLRRNAVQPCYGMAESVLMVTGTSHEKGFRTVASANGLSYMSVGRPNPGVEIRIAVEDSSAGVGEILIRSPTLAKRYFNGRPLIGRDGFFASGDLGFLDDGELFVTGRIGDRFKVNGQSYYASDVEHTLNSIPALRLGRNCFLGNGAAPLILCEPRWSFTLLRPRHLRRAISRHVQKATGIQVPDSSIVLLVHGAIRKTSSGKVMRQAMLEELQAGTLRQANFLRISVSRVRHAVKMFFVRSIVAGRARSERQSKPARI